MEPVAIRFTTTVHARSAFVAGWLQRSSRCWGVRAERPPDEPRLKERIAPRTLF